MKMTIDNTNCDWYNVVDSENVYKDSHTTHSLQHEYEHQFDRV